MVTVASVLATSALLPGSGVGVGEPTPALSYPRPFICGEPLWLGPGASSVQDLVPPRLRAVASAVYLLIITFIGLALGPYAIGRMSVAFGSLRPALLCGLAANLVAALILLLAMRHLERDEERAVRATETT